MSINFDGNKKGNHKSNPKRENNGFASVRNFIYFYSQPIRNEKKKKNKFKNPEQAEVKLSLRFLNTNGCLTPVFHCRRIYDGNLLLNFKRIDEKRFLQF